MLTNVHLQAKIKIKIMLKSLLRHYNYELIFPGERNSKGIEHFVIEYYMRLSTGILHIGAHEGGEASYYFSLDKPVLWAEANPFVFPRLLDRISKFQNQTAINLMIGEADEECAFFITDNEVSSSALPLTDIGELEWGILSKDPIKVDSRSLDSISTEFKIESYDFWVIDVQGLEMKVLRGGAKSLKKARFLLVECSLKNFYKDSSLYLEVKEFLGNIGYFPVLSPRGSHFEMLFINSN